MGVKVFSLVVRSCHYTPKEGAIMQWIHEEKLRAIRKGRGRDRRHFSIPVRSIQELVDGG